MTVTYLHPDADELIEVGGHLASSWGYDQTNVDFYRVDRRTEKTAWLTEVKAVGIWSEDGYNIKGVAPGTDVVKNHDRDLCEGSDPDRWHEHTTPEAQKLPCWVPVTLRRKIHSYTRNGGTRESVSINSFANAYPTDDTTPHHDTIATGGAGH